MSDVSRVEEVFLAAAELPDPALRATYLDEACAGDEDFRRRVETLLAAQPQLGRFLENPEHAEHAEYAADGPARRKKAPVSATVGERVGPYRLLERIGEGGMGEVWVADQLEPIKRRVAVKLIKPGMDSRSVLGRFEAERQALAVMDHPNITRVLDAGTTKDGRPYFVMELVKGTPITEFADARKLTPQQRLELFIPVCLAIQHAHMKGIIHRDIKPSNVLVALHDETPVPKVIDFGVARAIGQQLTENTIYTGFGALVGTPAYMAPEQATFNQLDIDTRADIYALGVLLYELLAGSPPIEKERLKKAALDEVLRIVRDEEPPRPSSRLSTSQAKASIAATRGSEVTKLAAIISGELDWIVMKALEKDRTRRYETANGFAADIQRYLAGEQVQAVPPSFGYRLRKAYRRNKAAVMVISAFVMVLTIGAALSTWLAIKATRAESMAEAKRLEAEEQAEKANYISADYSKLNHAYMEAAIESEIRNADTRLNVDLMEYETSDGRLGLLRLARPLKSFVGPLVIDLPSGSETRSLSFESNPEFVKLREFQTAAIILAGQEFLPLVRLLETPSTGSPAGFIWFETDYAYSPDRSLYAIHSYREGVMLLALPTFARMGLLREHDERVLHFGFTDDSKTIWTFDTDSIARFWNTDGSLRGKTPLLPHRFVYPGGLTDRQLRSSMNFFGNPPNECFVANGVAILRSKHADWVEHKENGELTRMTQKEGLEALSGPVELYSTETGQFIRRLDHSGRSISRWQISPDGRWLIYLDSVSDGKEEEQSKGADHQLVIVSAADGQELARLDHAWAKRDLSLTVSSRGTWLLAYQHGNTQQVALWRTSDWTLVNDGALDEALAHLDGLTYLNFVTDDILETSSDSNALSGVVQIGKPGSWTPSDLLWSPFGPIRSELNGRLLRQGHNLLSVDPIERLASPYGCKYQPRLAELAQDGRFWGSLDTVNDRLLPQTSLFEQRNYVEDGLGVLFSPAECNGRYFSEYGTVGMTRTNGGFELRILPDPKKLDIPPELLELWAQVITGGELAADGGFKPWDQPTWMAKQRELAAAKAPYADFPFPGWAATEPNLWHLIKARSSQDESERALHEGEWRRLTGRRPPVVQPDNWRTPEPAQTANEPAGQ